MMEGEGSDGGTDGGEESGGAGLSFRPWAVVFVGKGSFAFVGGRSRWRAIVFMHGQGVVSWALVIRAWGSLSSTLSCVVAVGVLEAGLLFMGAASSFVGGGARPWVVYVVRGWGGLMFVGCRYCTCMGWGQLWVIDEWGGRCFIVVSSWCVVLLLRCTICMVATSPCWRRGPCIWV